MFTALVYGLRNNPEPTEVTVINGSVDVSGNPTDQGGYALVSLNGNNVANDADVTVIERHRLSY